MMNMPTSYSRSLTDKDIPKLHELLWSIAFINHGIDGANQVCSDLESEGIWSVVAFMTDPDSPYTVIFDEVLKEVYDNA